MNRRRIEIPAGVLLRSGVAPQKFSSGQSTVSRWVGIEGSWKRFSYAGDPVLCTGLPFACSLAG
jgi:hypothetical protein